LAEIVALVVLTRIIHREGAKERQMDN
jgi:hypothetical protein